MLLLSTFILVLYLRPHTLTLVTLGIDEFDQIISIKFVQEFIRLIFLFLSLACLSHDFFFGLLLLFLSLLVIRVVRLLGSVDGILFVLNQVSILLQSVLF